MKDKPPIGVDEELRQSPTFWFAVLDQAKEAGDWDRAKQAETELRRLGVEVRFRRQKRKGVDHG